jgi:Zn-dependent metalloprotease
MSEAAAQSHADDVMAANPKLVDGVDGLRLISSEVDANGFGHVRYQQVQNDLDVVGGELMVHLYPNGTLFRLTDDLARNLDIVATPTHTADAAIAHALSLQSERVTQEAAPRAELVVVRHDGADSLAWKVSLRQVNDAGMLAMPVVFVDGHALKAVWTFDNLKSYSLSDADKVTYDNRRSTRYNRAQVGTSSDSELLLTHDSVGEALAFLSTNYGRNSYDGSGATVLSYGHYGRNYVNAFWDGSRLTFGDGDGSTSTYLGVRDIAAHELGHALTENEADLIYSYESGALNEGASDIFAAAVEASVDGAVTSDTWDMGEDCWVASSALRYMSRPSDDGSSRDHYSDRYTGSQDNGGVHSNSGIANHFFYLLTVGGQHHDPTFRSGYTVTGLGIDAAYDIWYSALNSYMTTSTDFAGARVATESACLSLGHTALECESVSYAWYEVGVGSDPGGTGGGGDTGGGDTGGGDTGGGDTGGDDTGGGDSGGGDSGGGDSGGDDTGTGGVTCPSGWLEVNDSLAATGDDDQFAYTTTSTGTHSFQLFGPATADFDLYLHKAKKRSGYSVAASSTSTGSTESITYSNGKATDYIIQVSSYAGSGPYVLCYDLP